MRLSSTTCFIVEVDVSTWIASATTETVSLVAPRSSCTLMVAF